MICRATSHEPRPGWDRSYFRNDLATYSADHALVVSRTSVQSRPTGEGGLHGTGAAFGTGREQEARLIGQHRGWGCTYARAVYIGWAAAWASKAAWRFHGEVGRPRWRPARPDEGAGYLVLLAVGSFYGGKGGRDGRKGELNINLKLSERDTASVGVTPAAARDSHHGHEGPLARLSCDPTDRHLVSICCMQPTYLPLEASSTPHLQARRRHVPGPSTSSHQCPQRS